MATNSRNCRKTQPCLLTSESDQQRSQPKNCTVAAYGQKPNDGGIPRKSASLAVNRRPRTTAGLAKNRTFPLNPGDQFQELQENANLSFNRESDHQRNQPENCTFAAYGQKPNDGRIPRKAAIWRLTDEPEQPPD